MEDTSEYIIVGAGSAGCVLADRLSASGADVVLLEAGPSDLHPMIHIPAGILHLISNPKVNWNYSSEPEESSGNRRIHWPRGRVLGGSSSINGMLYVRGNPADYDGWAQMGCRAWSFDEVLPYFKKSENYKNGGDEAFRSQGGPLEVEDYKTILDLTHALVEAASQAGHTKSKDLNGAQAEGVGYSQMTRKGRFRGSTAQTFLKQARKRLNLRVETNATVSKLIFEDKKCVGVKFFKHGKEKFIKAAKEVILSGGAVNSPHILQVSGIGSSEKLKRNGIKVVNELKGVGKNLQDHLMFRPVYKVKNLESLNKKINSLFGNFLIGLEYIFKQSGPMTMGASQVCGFAKSDSSRATPNLQFHVQPISTDVLGASKLHDFHGITPTVANIRPTSRGEINIVSNDSRVYPKIKMNYLSTDDDRYVAAQGLKLVRKIMLETKTFKKYEAEEYRPGLNIQDDEELVKAGSDYTQTIFHPVGTCKMGKDENAVVSEKLKVYGIENLRVIDASIMPNITSGNTNAPTIMIAEKGADMILND